MHFEIDDKRKEIFLLLSGEDVYKKNFNDLSEELEQIISFLDVQLVVVMRINEVYDLPFPFLALFLKFCKSVNQKHSKLYLIADEEINEKLISLGTSDLIWSIEGKNKYG